MAFFYLAYFRVKHDLNGRSDSGINPSGFAKVHIKYQFVLIASLSSSQTCMIFMLAFMLCHDLQAKYMAFLSSTRYSNPSGVPPQDHAQVLALTKVQGGEA
jgi:hypothetical protein